MTDRLKYKNPFAMGNLDDLMVAWVDDDVEYLKEWSNKAIKEHERISHIQQNTFEKLIKIKVDSAKFVEEIRTLLQSSEKTEEAVE